MREAGGHIIGDIRWARVRGGHCDRPVGEDASPCFECDPPGVDFERDGCKYIKWYVVREYRRRHGWYLQHRSCYNFVVAGADCCKAARNFVEAGASADQSPNDLSQVGRCKRPAPDLSLPKH
jgi:hypothetical protein